MYEIKKLTKDYGKAKGIFNEENHAEDGKESWEYICISKYNIITARRYKSN